MDPTDTAHYPTASTSTGKIRKKPGRKPNPASPALRKAQNREAQKAFRQRKEKHIKELEVDTKRLLQERDHYYKKSQQLSKENSILQCENWYLKGIVLSLQLVCFKTKLRIPRHTPHSDDKVQQVMAATMPDAMARHINGSVSTTSATSTNDNDDDNDDLANQPRDRRLSSVSTSSFPSSSSPYSSSRRSEFTTPTPPPPLRSSQAGEVLLDDIDVDDDTPSQPVLLRSTPESTTNNMAAIQALRLRLRIQSALFRENAAPQTTKPSPLQLSVPHDPRIDLIPTVHMRDRMILFKDQFDLEEVMRLLVNEAVFHGGNPSEASNWELPAVFFEKYWYLTTDYTLERTSQRWRQLKSMVANETELETATDQLQQQQPWEDRQRTNDLMAMMHPPVYSNTNDPAHYPDYDIPSYEFTGPSHTNPPPPPWNQSYPYM